MVANGNGGGYSYSEFSAPNLTAGTNGMRVGNAARDSYVAEWAMYDKAAADHSFTPPIGYFNP